MKKNLVPIFLTFSIYRSEFKENTNILENLFISYESKEICFNLAYLCLLDQEVDKVFYYYLSLVITNSKSLAKIASEETSGYSLTELQMGGETIELGYLKYRLSKALLATEEYLNQFIRG
ncbi:MAG: hypothetical protein R3E91_00995 [Chlamydiales bacterium]